MHAWIKYPGSKWGIADWIISFFPDHHSYIEPFLGSGAVLFNKPRSNIETVNDMDGDLVNLFEWVKRDPERLAYEIYYTPYAREVYNMAFEKSPKDSFQQAVYFFIRLNMGQGFRTSGEKVGWKNDVQGRERAYAASCWCDLPDRIREVAERLRGVQIECRPAIEVIQRFNSKKVLVYCDPPYVMSTRHGKQYKNEMNDQDHEELLEVLKAHKGSVLLSGYESELYEDMLQGWHREETYCYTQACRKKKEILWMNYEPSGQMRIEDYAEVMP